MSHPIDVEPADLRHVASVLDSATSAIELDVSTLESTLGPLSASWTGEASEAYQDAQSAWNDSMRHLRSLLGAISTMADAAADSYDKVDEGVAASF